MYNNPARPNEPICRYLRSKASAIPVADDAFYMEFHYEYEPFYCQKTLYPIGPDDQPVCPEECHVGRACFQPHPSFKIFAHQPEDKNSHG